MHEISLVRNMLKALEDEFPGRVSRIRGIYLDVGILSNVQPVLMQNAFEAVLLDEPKYSKASIHMKVLPVLVHCEECNTDSEVAHYKFTCSSCGKPCKNVVQGEELHISKVEFEELSETVNIK